jgi:DNA-directed RNA polymerase specialized sigma24 family protein
MTDRAAGRNPFGFPKTRWSLLKGAKESEQSRDLLFRLYYKPVYTVFSWLTHDPVRAGDLTQDFFTKEWQFCHEMEKGVVNRADPSKGRFRDYLTEALRKRWLTTIANAKRDRERTVEPADNDAWDRLKLPQIEHAERIFRRTTARTIVEEALRQTEAECAGRGKQVNFKLFLSRYLASSGKEDDWESIAREFRLPDGKTARNRAETAGRHFERILRELIAELDSDRDVAHGVRDLLADLGEDDD